MVVGTYCVRQIDTARPDSSVQCAAERMHQRAVGALVVVNDTDRVLGVVTDRDLVTRVLAKGLDPATTPLRDVMTASPKTVQETSSVATALSSMRAGRFRRLPVVDSNHTLVGLISLDDILMGFADNFSKVGQLLNCETPPMVVAEPDPVSVTRLQNSTRFGIGGDSC